MADGKNKLSDEYLKSLILDIPDFPQAGVVFRDITPLLKDADTLEYSLERMYEPFKNYDIDLVAGVDARGFILGAALANYLHRGFVPIRKKGKLPRDKMQVEYETEYGKGALEIHKDAIQPGQKVLIVDDVLATGGTAKASAYLVEQLEGEVVGLAFLVELSELKGRDRLREYRVRSVIEC